ncbi:MAG: hypothetical protein H7330_04715 [Hymenobacteraceae bacterium]|nr:hypothetical protein [Hymenobacteraceae bacterium]
MPEFDAAHLRTALRKLPEKEKDALLLRSVRRDAEWRATLAYELLPEVTRDTVYEAVSGRIHELLTDVSGYQLARFLTKTLKKAIAEINYARRITGERALEIDLFAYLLRELFDNYSGQLDSQYTLFYKAVAKLVIRLIKLIQKYLHEDLWLDYESEIADWLRQLRARPHRATELGLELPIGLQP